MQYRFLIFLFLLPCLLLAIPFKVASYNVQNLFDASYQGTEYPDYTPHKDHWNQAMVEIKLNHIAEVICDIDADMIGLQEIENQAILEQLFQRLEFVGCGYEHSAITAKKGATIQVAFLSRYPIVNHQDIEISTHSRVRHILEVDVMVGGQRLTLFVNHWKSKAYAGYESKRIASAKVLQERIGRLLKDRAYIILGDLNSDYDASLTLESKLNDSKGKTAFNDTLATKVADTLVDEYTLMESTQSLHYSLWLELDIDKRWSYQFYGRYASPDHIVLPKALFDGKGIDYVNNSFGVYKAEYLFHKRGWIYRWEYKNKQHTGKGYSDHLPVYAYFDTKPIKPMHVYLSLR
ncbi:MAG: endonuclease [Sulfurovum sp.]|nr:endonuclease [Sulfurovum sp.]